VKYRIHHQTVYRYDEPVHHSVHELRLTPQSGPLQQVEAWQMRVPGTLHDTVDAFGNLVQTFSLARPASQLLIEATGVVEVPGREAVFQDAPPPGQYRVSPLYYASGTPLTYAPPDMVGFAAPYLAAGVIPEALESLVAAIAERVQYVSNTTDVGTTAAEAFSLGMGVCQDQAQVMVACCRAFGIPARYVSGYFHAADAPNLASHAWADVCLDATQHRWISLDITHACPTDHRHVRLAVGRDYQSAAPIRGVRQGGGGESMDVSIRIDVIDDL
jgi:transglutaminase-like putative cysteine protease